MSTRTQLFITKCRLLSHKNISLIVVGLWMLLLGEHDLFAKRELVGLVLIFIHINPNGVPFTVSHALNGYSERDLAISFGNFVALNNVRVACKNQFVNLILKIVERLKLIHNQFEAIVTNRSALTLSRVFNVDFNIITGLKSRYASSLAVSVCLSLLHFVRSQLETVFAGWLSRQRNRAEQIYISINNIFIFKIANVKEKQNALTKNFWIQRFFFLRIKCALRLS